MKRFLALFLLVSAFGLFAAPEITIIGQVRHSFSPYGLKVNTFYLKKNFSAAEANKLIQSIKSSKMVVVAETATVVNAVFSNMSIKNALSEFFKNGGTFVLWIPSWSWMNSRPEKMYGYFSYYKVHFPQGYKGFGKGKIVTCEMDSKFAKMLNLPENMTLGTRGANNRPLRGAWQVVLRASDDSAAALWQENVMGNGKVLISYLPIMHDTQAAKFVEALTRYAYGDLLKK